VRCLSVNLEMDVNNILDVEGRMLAAAVQRMGGWVVMHAWRKAEQKARQRFGAESELLAGTLRSGGTAVAVHAWPL